MEIALPQNFAHPVLLIVRDLVNGLMAEKDPQLTQRQLSRDTGLSTTTINKLFTNKFDRILKPTTPSTATD